jgi:hypothetical protein
MGLLDTIGQHFRRRRERRDAAKQFRALVDPALVEYIRSDSLTAMPAPEVRDVEFVLVIVDDDRLDRLPQLLGVALEVLKAGGAMVDSVSGSLVLGTFGLLGHRDGQSERELRIETARQLHERLGQDASVVHGAGRAAVGRVGSAEAGFSHFGASLESYSAAVRLLLSLRRGEIREWTGGGAAQRSS